MMLTGRFVLLLASLLSVTYWIYSHGFTGNFKLDDFPNLYQLSHVTDLDTLLLFISSGNAGPSGRPLALLSFVLNQPWWNIDAEPFLYTNTLIHLINGLLLAWLTYRLLHASYGESNAATAALIAAALWLLHPMFASTTLYVIQRMTSLSLTFVLGGLLGYVVSRQAACARPIGSIIGMTASIVLGTALAVLCKENGAVLPALAWLTEAVFLSRENPEGKLKRWRQALTVMPTLALLAYIAYLLPGLPASYASRDFTLGERLLTEARVLLDYLRLLIVPIRSQMGLFHDDYVISHSWGNPPTTLPAVLAIIGMLSFAIIYRKKYPVLFFAVGWFFISHVMESSVIPLELYFEHRNYLPAIGLAIACGIGFISITPHLRRLAFALGLLYLTLISFVLLETATQWGNTMVAAELWYQENPNSDRAVQFYAQSLSTYNRLDEIDELYKRIIKEKPENSSHRLQQLITYCLRQEPLPKAEWETLHQTLGKAQLNFAVPGSIEKISDIAIDNTCPTVITKQDAITLAEVAVANPQFLTNAVVAHWLYMTLAQLYDTEGDYEKTLSSLRSAKQYRNYPGTSLMIASVLATHNEVDNAIVELDATLRELSPYSPNQRHWFNQVKEFRQTLASLRTQASR
jgi:tetratricopeptide (TPR) repeat protein